ncbi:RNA polymerase II-associated protein 3 [Osmia bicornis bicornis]|uniref:RNA polymerase II-associated protein 3 n=1 Tax=Osmia bicornis bicornis TaxID=1437191 RepID=UPI001EAF644D|nr:RNA polymerase II-associated protein 3 [Osmia bicornis bicornis]
MIEYKGMNCCIMDANDTDVRVVKNEKKSLLQKYDVPVEHLSYEYISECTDGKKLERIVTILRSGEEGYYPDLTKHAEERLVLLKPTSIILRKSEPILRLNMLEPNKYTEIEKDINTWTSEMQSREKDLKEGRATLIDPLPHPDIRQLKEGVTEKPVAINSKNTKKNKRLSSCDYGAWDKYDVDTELNKIDIRDEQQRVDAKRFQQKQKEITEKKKLEKNTIIDKASLTGTELNVMAEQEREKGNEAFRAGDYKEALEHYSTSIKMDSNATAFNNRAMTYIKLQRYKDALDDCNVVLNVEYKNIKALLRRAVTLEHLDKSSQALADYEAVLKLEPTNAVAIAGVKKLRKPCESRKVRMAIEEQTEDTNEKLKSTKNSNEQFKERLSLENSICFCDRAPGPSQNLGPRPHIKADYCLEDEKKQTVTIKNNVPKKLETERKNTSGPVKIIDSSSNGNNRSFNAQKKNDSPQTTKPKSIFSCSVPSKRASSVLIEEIPRESNDSNSTAVKSESKEIAKSKTVNKNNKCDNKTINASSIRNLNRNLEENCNLNGKHDNKWSPRKVQVADKYTNKTSKSEKYVPKNFSNIESAYDFMKAWKSLKNDTDLKVHAQLLRSLNIDKLSSVLGNELDGDMFSTIVHCLEQHFCSSNDTEILNKFLKSFSQVQRFSIINMFMNAKDKQAIKNILNFLEEHGMSEVSSLRQIYCI